MSAGAPALTDEPKVERKIRKEPAYSSKSPKYCLLAFGPKAETRVWLVLDGDTFYIDHNSNGDLTEPSKRVPIDGKTEEKDDDGRTFFKTALYEQEVKVGQRERRIDVVFEHTADFREAGCVIALRDPKVPRICSASMTDRPEQAEVLHLDGPLTLQLADGPDGPPLVRGKEAKDLCVCVGTFTAESSAVVLNKAVPTDVHPLAEIEFPSKQVGGEPIKVKVVLNRRC
jgi:hypothetical protein